jgi:hypothetical protein
MSLFKPSVNALLGMAAMLATLWMPQVLAVVQLEEAVLPEWPGAKRIGTAGKVVVDFVIGPSGKAYVTQTRVSGLGKSFATVAAEAMSGWRFSGHSWGGCALQSGRQEFLFDLKAPEIVSLGETLVGKETPTGSMTIGSSEHVTRYSAPRAQSSSEPGYLKLSQAGGFQRVQASQQRIPADGRQSERPKYEKWPELDLLPGRSGTLTEAVVIVDFGGAGEDGTVPTNVRYSSMPGFFDGQVLEAARSARFTSVTSIGYCHIFELSRN